MHALRARMYGKIWCIPIGGGPLHAFSTASLDIVAPHRLSSLQAVVGPQAAAHLRSAGHSGQRHKIPADLRQQHSCVLHWYQTRVCVLHVFACVSEFLISTSCVCHGTGRACEIVTVKSQVSEKDRRQRAVLEVRTVESAESRWRWR